MGELDLATVAAANDAWVLEPEGSEVVETAEFRLARFPERFPDPLQVQWVRSARAAEEVLGEVVARAVELGPASALVYMKLSAPVGFEEALLGRGAQLVATADVLARALPADIEAPDLAGLEVRWVTTPEAARDGLAIGISVFGGSMASDDELGRRAAGYRDSVAAGKGGPLVAYLDGTPVAMAGFDIADGVARLAGGAVLEAYRGRGVYRALVAARLRYAGEQGAGMAFTHGDVTTSSPILQRLGFVSYGQERVYRLPLG
jgi:GNAT superfamily N-acetyltransferase